MFDREMSYRVKDMLRLLFGALSLIMIFALISFDENDLKCLTTQTNDPFKNYIGIVGAYGIFALRFLFGNAVWAIPVLLICWVFNTSQLKSYGELYKEFLGSLFVLMTVASFFVLVENNYSNFLYKGGLVGAQIADSFMFSFNFLGSILILGFFLILSLALATEFLLVSVIVFVISKSGIGLRNSFLWISRHISLPVFFSASHRKDAKEDEYQYDYKDEEEDEYQYDYKDEEKKDQVEIAPSKKPWLRIVKSIKKKKKEKKKKTKPILDFYEGELPPLDLLDSAPDEDVNKRTENVEETSRILGETLRNFDIAAEVVAVNQGPVITVYEVQPAPGVKINRIVNLENDIALALSASSVRIVAPIPGKAVIGIEIPNKFPEKVYFRDLIDSDEFQDASSKLTMVLGKDVAGDPMINNLDAMPHLLIAGSTGAGKTVCLNSLIMSILYKSTPDEVRMIMVDPKMVEMTFYNGIPHLLVPVITNSRKAADALIWAVTEMERRYELFADVGVRNIAGYHKRFENSKVKTYKNKRGEEEPLEKVPYIVIIIDELADLMMTVAQDVETSICRLAQLSRAVGVHLILATQRPSVNVLTGLIKSNLPCRISFRVASSIDSRTILDSKGGEALIGKGDMLFIPPGLSTMLRVQGCFLTDEEIKDVVAFLREQRDPEYVNIFASAKAPKTGVDQDEIYDEAVCLVIETKQASASFLQRRMRIGYNRASRLIDAMEANGVISGARGSKPREILLDSFEPSDEEKYEEKKEEKEEKYAYEY